MHRLSQREILIQAAENCQLPVAIQQFIHTTFGFSLHEKHIIAAAFVYGREAITSSLFVPLVQQLELNIPAEQKTMLQPLLYYLNRHIELDETEHLPRAIQMLVNLAGEDPENGMRLVNTPKFHYRLV